MRMNEGKERFKTSRGFTLITTICLEDGGGKKTVHLPLGDGAELPINVFLVGLSAPANPKKKRSFRNMQYNRINIFKDHAFFKGIQIAFYVKALD